MGAASVTPTATGEAALDSIDAHRPTVAMLDFNLGDRTSFPVADRLSELGIPYLFATGYDEQVRLPPEHVGQQVVQKPYTLENVARAFDQLMGTASVPQ